MSGSCVSKAIREGKIVARVWSHRDRKLLPIKHLHTRSAPNYATLGKLEGTSQSSTAPRKSVTVTNDDGRVPWKELSTGEKAARTTQTSFNLGVVFAGAAGTVRSSLHTLYYSNANG